MHGRNAFLAFRSSRRRASSGPIRLNFVDDDSQSVRAAFAINRKVGGAVVRNRLRRRLRAICRELGGELVPGSYLISVAPVAADSSYEDLRAHVKTAGASIKGQVS